MQASEVMENYALVERSGNAKTGAIGLVTASSLTCWDGCPFTDICYPNGGHLRNHWKAVDRGARGTGFEHTCRRIAALSLGSTWRWGDAGDLPGVGPRIRRSAVKKIIVANRGKRGFCLTHKPVVDGEPYAVSNRGTIRLANETQFTINLSAEGWLRADVLADLGIAPVVTVLPSTMPSDWKVSSTPAGRRIVRCPAEWSKEAGAARIRCENCGGKGGPLCWRSKRNYIIGFTVHGNMTRKMNDAIAEVEMFPLQLRKGKVRRRRVQCLS